MMTDPKRTLAFLLVAALPVVACDDAVDLPSAPGGEVPFTRVAISEVTLEPEPGGTVPVGGNVSYSAEVFAQWETGSQVDRFGIFWVELLDDEFGWESDIVTRFFEPDNAGDETVRTTFTGTFTPPQSTDLCFGYDEIAFAAAISRDTALTEPDLDGTESEKAITENTFERISIAGLSDATGPQGAACTTWSSFTSTVPHWWGEDLIVFVRNLPAELRTAAFMPTEPTILVGEEEQPAQIILRVPIDGFRDGSVTGFVLWTPNSVTGGPLRTLIDGTEASETLYGLDRLNFVGLPFGFEDFLEIFSADGRNDSFDSPSIDPAARDWIDPLITEAQFVVNPELSMDEADLQVDPSANPEGLDIYGVGDWFEFTTPEAMRVVAHVWHRSGEGLDLRLYDEDGTFLPPSSEIDGSNVHRIEVAGVPAGTLLRLWVAPDPATFPAGGPYGIAITDRNGFVNLPNARNSIDSPDWGVRGLEQAVPGFDTGTIPSFTLDEMLRRVADRRTSIRNRP